MTNQQLLSIAQAYREHYKELHPCMLNYGYVRIFQGEAYGWCAEKVDPQTERPSALLVSLSGKIFEAVGGDSLKGAKKWIPYNKK